jgi:hypothetical protein
MLCSVGLQRNESKWAFLGIDLKYSAEVMRGEQRFTIHWSQAIFGRNIHYTLLDSKRIHQQCDLIDSGSICRMDLSFGEEQFLRYEVDFFGRAVFKTRDAVISTIIEVPGNRRSFTIDGMRFEHYDYQSSMRFECSPNRFNQAAMVANLLFNPPLQNQNS